jgi:hypothetical protein
MFDVIFSGTYSIGSAQQCTSCPAGSACPSTNANTQIACSAGEYAFEGSSNCTVCPAGWQCPKTDGSSNNPCLPGFFSVGREAARGPKI